MKQLRSIVIIDDDPICSWLNRTFLEDLQVAQHIECFSDGYTALDYFHTTCNNPNEAFPDLVFLDINMPGIDGFQFLEKLKALDGCELMPTNRIVFLTTSMHKRDIERSQHYQIKNYLVKPLTEAKIKELLLRMAPQEILNPGEAKSTESLKQKPQDRLPAENPQLIIQNNKAGSTENTEAL